ncbi:unnamed protein product [Caenorhabditis brenneri]
MNELESVDVESAYGSEVSSNSEFLKKKDSFTIEDSTSRNRIRSNLNPFIGFDQSDLVLVDRPEPPADKAWCSSDKNPVLTVDLAKYFTLTAVSYQHSKWNETIPDDAPKEYSVVVRIDHFCK